MQFLQKFVKILQEIMTVIIRHTENVQNQIITKFPLLNRQHLILKSSYLIELQQEWPLWTIVLTWKYNHPNVALLCKGKNSTQTTLSNEFQFQSVSVQDNVWVNIKKTQFSSFFQKFALFQTTGPGNGFIWVSQNPWQSGQVASQAKEPVSKCPKICSSWKKGKTEHILM